MLPASTAEACRSPSVLVARYRGWQPYKADPPEYFKPPVAEFEVNETLSGPPIRGSIRVRYDFHDGSPCIAPQEWRFSEDELPEIGSSWVLYLSPGAGDDVYLTYRGDYGRKQLSEMSRDEALQCSAPR